MTNLGYVIGKGVPEMKVAHTFLTIFVGERDSPACLPPMIMNSVFSGLISVFRFGLISMITEWGSVKG